MYYQIVMIMGDEGLHKNINSEIWTECIGTLTNLENIMGSQHKDKCVYDKV